MSDLKCYCGSNNQFELCCEPFLEYKTDCQTPEQLMRSRFTAFAIGNPKYLLFTSSNSLKLQLSEFELQQTIDSFSFIKLDVISANKDTVEFCAHLLMSNEHHQIQEVSTFIQENGLWKYDSGELDDVPLVKLSRNDMCPCGSGKKFKKCHQN